MVTRGAVVDADAYRQQGGLIEVDVNGGALGNVGTVSVLAAPITGGGDKHKIDLPDLTGGVIDGRMHLGHTLVSLPDGPTNVKYALSLSHIRCADPSARGAPWALPDARKEPCAGTEEGRGGAAVRIAQGRCPMAHFICPLTAEGARSETQVPPEARWTSGPAARVRGSSQPGAEGAEGAEGARRNQAPRPLRLR